MTNAPPLSIPPAARAAALHGPCWPPCLCHSLGATPFLQRPPAKRLWVPRPCSRRRDRNWLREMPGALRGTRLSPPGAHGHLLFLPEVLETLILGLYGFLRAGPRKQKKENHSVIKEDVDEGNRREV